jgi:hypothetical protein
VGYKAGGRGGEGVGVVRETRGKEGQLSTNPLSSSIILKSEELWFTTRISFLAFFPEVIFLDARFAEVQKLFIFIYTKKQKSTFYALRVEVIFIKVKQYIAILFRY